MVDVQHAILGGLFGQVCPLVIGIDDRNGDI